MNQTEEKINKLQMIADAIETLGMNDVDGWNDIFSHIQDTYPYISQAYASLSGVLELSAKGVRTIADQSQGNVFAAVDAVTKGIVLCKQCLEKGIFSEDEIDAAVQRLSLVLSEQALNPSSPFDSECSASIDVKMNNIASLLIKSEPNDLENVLRIKELIIESLDNDGLIDSMKIHMQKALELMDGILNSQTDMVDKAWTEISECIDEAIQNFECQGCIQKEELVIEKQFSNECDVSQDYMPKDPDMDLLSEFITEGSELISHAEEALLKLELDPENMEAVGTVFRAFHTIKGTSAFLELSLLAEMGHHAESLLSRVRDKEICYKGGYADLALKSLDMLKNMIQQVERAIGGEPLVKPEGYDALMKILSSPEEAGVCEEIEEMDHLRIGDILVASGKVSRDTVETLVQSNPDEPIGLTVIKTKTASVTDVGHALRSQERIKGTKQTIDSSVRVSTERLDRLIDMVGELVIAHSMVSQDNVVVQASNHELLKKVNQTNKIVRGLQDLCMSMRMVPLKSTFQKMARLVRDVAKKVGKNVQFITEGEDTEIDRNLVDIINDPLVHMVRNAVDHGIEPPEIRKQKGKPIIGTVKLSACHSAGSVVVQITDDGKGLDRNVIYSKAVEKGLINEGTSMSDRDIYNLVLEPGFSTAEVVTDVSGRGVGMDVVKKNIESLRGQIEIQSEAGKGSVFRMSLPLTLAIIDGMMVKVGEEIYVIPTASIVRTIKPDIKDISTVFNKGKMLSIQGNLIPLHKLTGLYKIPVSENGNEGLVVVIEDDENQVGLIIDELIGRQQVVVKTLGETMQEIPGISGGAILPNGRVGLIVDVGGLMKLSASNLN